MHVYQIFTRVLQFYQHILYLYIICDMLSFKSCESQALEFILSVNITNLEQIRGKEKGETKEKVQGSTLSHASMRNLQTILAYLHMRTLQLIQ